MPDNFDEVIYEFMCINCLLFFSAYKPSNMEHCNGNFTYTKWLLQLQVIDNLIYFHVLPVVHKKQHFIKQNNWRHLPVGVNWQLNRLFCKL